MRKTIIWAIVILLVTTPAFAGWGYLKSPGFILGGGPISYCNECGEGVLNACDRLECSSATLETCYYDARLIGGSCTVCSPATICGSYGDDWQTCTSDPCGLGDCEWEGDSCITVVPPPPPPPQKTHDIVVVGAGTGGFGAAVQAARMGRNVALLEETDYIGGMAGAAAVSTMDGNMFWRSSGLYKEFAQRVIAHYQALGKSVGTCYWNTDHICPEPKIVKEIMEQMLAEAGVDISLRASVVEVLKTSNVVTGVRTQNGTVFNADVVIEATEYGDVLALSSTAYWVGSESNTKFGEGSAIGPITACLQDITYSAVIKKYPAGLPPGFWTVSQPPGYTGNRSKFLPTVTPGGSAWFDAGGAIVYPVNITFHNAYRGMPDSSSAMNYDASYARYRLITKTGLNWANDWPYAVSDLDRENRFSANCEAKLHTLQFLYYLQHDLGQSMWSVANDEGFNTGYNSEENSCPNVPAEFKTIEANMALLPYIREGRRLNGVEKLTVNDVMRTDAKPRGTFWQDSIAIGDYGVDLHGCKEIGTPEEWLQWHSWNGNPFQVPFGALIPETTDGLVVADKSISASHVANGATRHQPIAMLTGQAAGTIAALASQYGIHPRDVNVKGVQDVLLNAGSKLFGYSDIPGDHPQFVEIERISLESIMQGYPDFSFRSGNNLSRAEIAVVMTRLFNLPHVNPAVATFADVPISLWAFRYVESLYASGLTAGCSKVPMLYCPDSNVKRSEMAVFIVRGLGEQPYTGTRETFPDVPKTHWSHPFVETVYERGIMVGYGDGTFRPDTDISRGDTAVVSHATLEYLGRI